MAGPFCLKKNSHCDTVLEQLLRDDIFTDVTLTAEGSSIKAHKNILSLASSYFQQVLMRDQNMHTVIVFRDMKFSELKNLIKFIYIGEAIVDVNELKSFMEAAQSLKIYSLIEPHTDNSSCLSSENEERTFGLAKGVAGIVDEVETTQRKKIKSESESDGQEKEALNGDLKEIKEEPDPCDFQEIKIEHETMSPKHPKVESPSTSTTIQLKAGDDDDPYEFYSNEIRKQSLSERLSSVTENSCSQQWMALVDDDDDNNKGGVHFNRNNLLSSLSSLDSSSGLKLPDFDPFPSNDTDNVSSYSTFSTYARGRIYPSPAQENIKKLILRTEAEVNELYTKINSDSATPEEKSEFEVKRNALVSYKRLLRNKINAARRSMKSREKKKQRKGDVVRSNSFRPS